MGHLKRGRKRGRKRGGKGEKKREKKREKRGRNSCLRQKWFGWWFELYPLVTAGLIQVVMIPVQSVCPWGQDLPKKEKKKQWMTTVAIWNLLNPIVPIYGRDSERLLLGMYHSVSSCQCHNHNGKKLVLLDLFLIWMEHEKEEKEEREERGEYEKEGTGEWQRKLHDVAMMSVTYKVVATQLHTYYQT